MECNTAVAPRSSHNHCFSACVTVSLLLCVCVCVHAHLPSSTYNNCFQVNMSVYFDFFLLFFGCTGLCTLTAWGFCWTTFHCESVCRTTVKWLTWTLTVCVSMVTFVWMGLSLIRVEKRPTHPHSKKCTYKDTAQSPAQPKSTALHKSRKLTISQCNFLRIHIWA